MSSGLVSSTGSSIIQNSGLASGLDVNTLISELVSVQAQPMQQLYTQEQNTQTELSTLNTVQATVSSLQSSIETLTDGTLASGLNLFNNRTATSSDSTVATCTAATAATIQSVKLKVDQLATSTTATGTNIGNTLTTGDSSLATDSSKVQVGDLDNGNGTSGSFSFYVNGNQYNINISDSTNSIDSVIQAINATNTGSLSDPTKNSNGQLLSGVTASVNNGQISLSYSGNASSFVLGSNSDTSNFLQVTGLQTADVSSQSDQASSTNTISYTSKPVYVVKTSESLVSSGMYSTSNLPANTAITAGSIYIGGAEFTIDANTTLNDLLYNINSSSTAGVTAEYDVNTNKLVLTSKNAGNVPIALSEPTDTQGNKSNVLEALGLISVDDNGNENSLASQTLGLNSIAEVNGTKIISATNNLTSSTTGIQGLTINLNMVTSNAIHITVAQDTGSLTSAINSFISDYNNTIDQISQNTAVSGALQSEYSLVMFSDDLRSKSMDMLNNPNLSTYKSLPSIGISTGAVGASISSDTSHLQLNSSTFLDALQNNPYEVQTLLIGDPTKGVTGVLQSLNAMLTGELDPVNGYFTSTTAGLNAQISDYNTQISNDQDQLSSYQSNLTQEFASMNQLISQMKSQSSAASGL